MLDLEVTIPWNTSATIRGPLAAETIAESGTDLTTESLPAGVRSLDEDTATLEVGSGSYTFAFTLE